MDQMPMCNVKLVVTNSEIYYSRFSIFQLIVLVLQPTTSGSVCLLSSTLFQEFFQETLFQAVFQELVKSKTELEGE